MPNLLIHEQSPYLLQHAHNPVDWYPWCDEAFARARAAHKPVIVSIGYAACHWCHVMERESFEDATVAAFMNEHFICIKVDREEHPDVDHLYMDAVQAMTGSGGWPLNAFVTPDRIPFYGGTYFPPKSVYNRPSWMQVLERIQGIWETQQEEVSAQSGQMLQYLQQAAEVAVKPHAADFDETANNQLRSALMAMADTEWGGFGQAPKFPGSMAINYLLENYHYTGAEAALKQALLSLDKMLDGGIYDQLNGGFARYSTDRYWLAPHFEKMLYDNALLVQSLCHAYQLTGTEKYRIAIEETIGFVERELAHPDGGFYSALDADSEGEEGKFYTWTWDEWLSAFPDGNPLGAAFFGVVPEGNWEHTNILHIRGNMAALAKASDLDEAAVRQHILQSKAELRSVQKLRQRPHTDDKCLLSWNALMNMALTRAGVVLRRAEYLTRAGSHLQWMLDVFSVEDGLKHSWKAGPARISAKLDDYAYLMQALLQYGSVSGSHFYISMAGKILRNVIRSFSDPQQLFFRFTASDQQDIPVRKTDIYDGAMPSANAVMAHNLLLCGMALEQHEWVERAQQMLNTISETSVRYPYSFGYWATLLQRGLAGFKTAVITGERAAADQDELQGFFLPEVFALSVKAGQEKLPIMADKNGAGEAGIFVCTVQECKAPEASVAAALKHFPAALRQR